MALFDFFKNKKNNPEHAKSPSPDQEDIERFEKEVLATIPRYFSTPKMEVNINARHRETQEIIPFAVGFADFFGQWRNVKSQADRRGIIYALLDTQFGNQLELWQEIERSNDDRYAERAFTMGITEKTAADEQNPDFWSALAKTNFILRNYEEAENNCQKAFALDGQHIRTKRIYADILHNTNREKEAHTIYGDILTDRLPKDEKISIKIEDFLGFDGDLVNSPIYALAWLSNNKQVTEAEWEWANEEFYYSPDFRSQYAYKLLKDGDVLKGFAKLYALSEEMPWYKEAVMNTVLLIDQLNLTGQEIQADKQKYLKIIERNNWSDANMYQIKI